MNEFVLKINDGDGFGEPFPSYSEMLRPASISATTIPGWGSHRILVNGSEVSFSDEDFGFHVVFETGDPGEERAVEIVEDIARNITILTGAATSIVSL